MRAAARGACRSLSTAAPPPPLSMADKVRAFGSLLGTGLASGALGGLVGLGAHGSPIMVPALKSMAKHSTATATGTAAVAVVSTGLAGCLGFATAGSFEPSKGMFGKVTRTLSSCLCSFTSATGARPRSPASLASRLPTCPPPSDRGLHRRDDWSGCGDRLAHRHTPRFKAEPTPAAALLRHNAAGSCAARAVQTDLGQAGQGGG